MEMQVESTKTIATGGNRMEPDGTGWNRMESKDIKSVENGIK